MVDTPFPRPYMDGQNARAKDELRKKLDSKDYDKGFEKEVNPEDQIRNLIRNNTPSLPKPTMAEQETSAADRIRNIKKASSLSIVSSDHSIEDSPNAAHVNENLGKSVAMMAVKTLGRRKSIIDGRSRPLAKRMRRRYVYENIDVSEQANFGAEFNRAREAGEAEFTFGGKKYSTMKKGEDQDQWRANLKKPQAPIPLPRPASRMPVAAKPEERPMSQNPANVSGQKKEPVSGLNLPMVNNPAAAAKPMSQNQATAKPMSQNPANVSGQPKATAKSILYPNRPEISVDQYVRSLPGNNPDTAAGLQNWMNKDVPKSTDVAPSIKVAPEYNNSKSILFPNRPEISVDQLVNSIPSNKPSTAAGLQKWMTMRESTKYLEKFKKNMVKENESEIEVTNNSDDENSPKEKNRKPEKRGNLVTINPKLNDNK